MSLAFLYFESLDIMVVFWRGFNGGDAVLGR